MAVVGSLLVHVEDRLAGDPPVEERTERATQRMATLAEPAMIVVFGVIVAFVALSLLQAIYGINASSFK